MTRLSVFFGIALGLSLLLAADPAAPLLAAQQPQPFSPTPAKARPAKDTAEAAKPKKVWTNDNIDALSGSVVSVVGKEGSTGDAQNQKSGAKSAQLPMEKDPMYYRAQLAPLRADIERTNAEIQRMREFLAGGHTGEGILTPNRFSVPMNPSDRITQLEKHKSEVQAKINAIEDQARHNSIPPGDLR